MFGHAEKCREVSRGLKLALMALAVIDGKREQRAAIGFRNRRAGGAIYSTG
jgi:hypothetical protein